MPIPTLAACIIDTSFPPSPEKKNRVKKKILTKKMEGNGNCVRCENTYSCRSFSRVSFYEFDNSCLLLWGTPETRRHDYSWSLVISFGSGSGLDPDSIRSVDLYPDPDSESGSGPRREKITHKKEEEKNFMFSSAWCSLVRAEGFFCSFDVLYGRLGIGKLQFLVKKILNIFSSCK